MSINTVLDILQKEQEENIKNSGENIKKLAKKIAQKIDAVEAQLNDKNSTETALHNLLLTAEQIYYESLHYGWSVDAKNKKSELATEEPDVSELLHKNKNTIYEITGSKENGFILKMPMAPKRFDQRKTVSGKIINKTLKEMIKNHLDKSQTPTPVYEKAHAIFTVYIGEDISFAAAPDGDNLDLKHIIDALHSLIITNDTVLVFSYEVRGKTTKGTSYIELKVQGK